METTRTLNNHRVRRIGAFPPLSPETERDLCIRWRDHHDISAAHQLTGSHLYLVAETAWTYRGFGVRQEDLIGEGHIGLMRAVCRFDPNCGLRFPSYARWWIHTAIQEHLMHNGSAVNEGTADRHEQLPLNLQHMRGSLPEFDNSTRKTQDVSLVVAPQDVLQQKCISTDRRMAGPDVSFKPAINADHASEYGSWVVDDTEDEDASPAERDECNWHHSLRFPASEQLISREGSNRGARHVGGRPTASAEMGQGFHTSLEHIR